MMAAKEIATSVSHMAERWKDLSEQTGISTDAVQKYDAAFKRVGLTAEDAAKAFDVLTDKRQDALSGGAENENMFRRFGISEDELKNLVAKISEQMHLKEAELDVEENEKGERMLIYRRGDFKVVVKYKESVNYKIKAESQGDIAEEADYDKE